MPSRSDDAADRPLSTQPIGTRAVAIQAASFVIDGVARLFLSSCLNRNHKRRGATMECCGSLALFEMVADHAVMAQSACCAPSLMQTGPPGVSDTSRVEILPPGRCSRGPRGTR
jgi:hypothetical protein